MSSDILQRFIFESEPVRGEYVKLGASFVDILKQHDYPAPVRRLLGESLCAVVLLSAIIKFEGRVTIQFRGKGKLRLLLAQCDDQYRMRGIAKYDTPITSEDLLESFKEGVLTIMLDSGVNGQRYQGVVEWKGNSMAESIENYFQNSEQLATKIWLTANESMAAGFLLQIVPPTEQGASAIQEEIDQASWQHVLTLTNKHHIDEILQTDYPAFLSTFYPEDNLRVFEGSPVKFHCSCTRKRGEDAISLLGREEAEEELRDKQSIVVTCDFCNKEYVFDRVDVEAIFKKHQEPPENLH